MASEVLISSAGNRFFYPRPLVAGQVYLAGDDEDPRRAGGSPTAYTVSRTNRAHYVTEVSGALVVTPNWRFPLTVNCTRNVQCGTKIAH
jgi:hypothetical protein